jgi:hypothetical protein
VQGHVNQVLPGLRVFGIPFGHTGHKRERVVVEGLAAFVPFQHRETMYMEVILVRGFFLPGQYVQPKGVLAPDVVEHRVQHHLRTLPVRFANQFP